MKRYIAILAAAVLAAACSEKSTDAGSGNFTVSVSATQADVTRTVMDDGVLGWTTSDALGVYADKIQQNKHFVINSSCDRFYGAFVFTGSSYTSATYRAYYPYRSTSSGTVISATLPAVQNGPWDSSADFMVSEPLTAAYTEDPDKFPELDFRFKSSGHLFGIVKLTLQDGPKAELENESISFVQIKTGGTPLAGDFRFDVAKPENGASFTSSADSVRVVFSGGNAPSLASPVTVYAVVRPTLSPVTNMTVTVTTTGGTASFNSSQSVSIARGTIKELPPITVSEKWERLPSLNSRFTDAAFLAYMLEKLRQEQRRVPLWPARLQMVGSINCASLGISSLKGIELAENLVSLDCSGNSISSLDLSANTKLRDLNCSVPSLGTLDISGCTQLQTLDISGTAIPALDLSGCQSLQTLTANACGLKTLDLSGNPVRKNNHHKQQRH
ncbi:MAG: fimbrillin family protein [Alistipes putredinis]|nr:MAG: fimbrillin family protein [Alistipes putredinis]